MTWIKVNESLINGRTFPRQKFLQRGVQLPCSITFLAFNRPFPSCSETHYESEAKCKAFHMQIRFVCIWMKTNFREKSFALSLIFIMRFKATRKWPIASCNSNCSKYSCVLWVDSCGCVFGKSSETGLLRPTRLSFWRHWKECTREPGKNRAESTAVKRKNIRTGRLR